MSNNRKHLIAGTAGHIDHGKTSLVRALTGVDTDRLKEEKERGITIDLGFASSALSNDITLSWIDVPGHERFIGNMLAGVAGIDFVVLVVAANEGVMPQTREHFEICRLLGVKHGIVAITKADLVDEDGLELAIADVQGLTSGSFLASADIIPVSVASGHGIEDLRASITQLAAHTGARLPVGNFRLPIDRSFVMKGFGTVVTGTVFNGSLGRDAEVELLPAGRRLRVRGVQVHGMQVPSAARGQRAAINLVGIDADEIQRGNALVAPGTFRLSRHFDVEVLLLEDAPTLPNFSPVHFHAGTQSTVAKIRFLDGLKEARGGQRIFARMSPENPVCVLPGDRFIIRRFSPVVTIGGGKILDNQPPRIRRKDAGIDRLRAIADFGPEAAISAYCDETPYGCALKALIPRLGATPEEILVYATKAGLRLLGPQRDWIVAKEQLETISEQAQQLLAAFHRNNAMLPGIPRERFRHELGKNVPDVVVEWLLTQDTRFVAQADTVRLAVHRPSLSVEESAASHRIEQAFLAAGLQVPAAAEVLRTCGIDETRGNTILRTLLREGRLVKVGQDLIFHKQILGQAIALLLTHRGERFSVPVFKEWTGVSRKYAIPLLEFFDRQRVTRRDGDTRVVL